MVTFSKISASLDRTQASVSRLDAAEKRLDRRFRRLEENLQEIRVTLESGRGQRIRGQISRAVNQASAVLSEIELVQVRADRVRHKARNLGLDAEHGLGGLARVARGELLTKSRRVISQVDEKLAGYPPLIKKVTAIRGELMQHSIKAEWHYKIDLCIDLFRSGYDELGLSRLLELCYGPDTPGDHRRRAMNELLSWGHTVQDEQLIEVATKHLYSYVSVPDRASASERELVLRIEGVREARHFSDPEVFLLIVDASKRATADALLAAANLVAKFELERMPQLGHDLQLLWINKTLAVQKLEPIRFDRREGVSLFDTVDCDIDPSSYVQNGAKVTVIVPAWNSQDWLATAIRGLVKQSWRNLEIIIVDDCSEDSTLAVAKKLAKQDERIRVLSNETNRGAYASRNWALAVSTGQYITVHDADDWSHPRKIERQVAHLEKNASIVANVSQSVRIDQDSLLFFAQYGREILRQNSSSLMFARETVFEELGYWDEVKFGADTEFHHRIRSKFGPESAPVAKLGMLSLTRYHTASLTGGGKQSTQRGIVGARRDYLGKFSAWHKQIKEDETFSLYLERSVENRPFPIPVSSAVDENNRAHFDVLILANLSLDTPWLLSTYDLARKLSAKNQQVAFLHLPGLLRPTQAISDQFEQLVADGAAVRIYAENDCEADRVLIQASSLSAENVLMPELKSDFVQVIYDNEEIEVDFAAAARLALAYFGSEPEFFGADRETKKAISQAGQKVSQATKVWKFD
jgi:glycosyltransferase involved in cell wall biosynthesis